MGYLLLDYTISDCRYLDVSTHYVRNLASQGDVSRPVVLKLQSSIFSQVGHKTGKEEKKQGEFGQEAPREIWICSLQNMCNFNSLQIAPQLYYIFRYTKYEKQEHTLLQC